MKPEWPRLHIIPAIDLKGGRCVRLQQGRADREKIYSEDPVAMAMNWYREGATYLHIVDLDGAFEGHPVHTEVIAAIVRKTGMPVEVGGGLRTDEDVQRLLECGVTRAIIGTRVLEQPDALPRLVEQFADRLAVSIDARDGMVQVKGWVETSGQRAVDLGIRMDKEGVQTLIYTDTARDGMLEGVNAEGMGEMCRHVKCQVIASGGVASAADITALRALNMKNLGGVIVGKALYEGRVTIPELVAMGA